MRIEQKTSKCNRIQNWRKGNKMQDENREVEEKIINWGGRKRKSIGCISEERRKEKKG